MNIRYWHGGIPDLKPGDLLLPPDVTGTERTLADYTPANTPPGHVRRDRVHLTTERNAARAYAAAYPDGALYIAEPVGEHEPDPDAPDISIRCESARIIRVYDPCVLWRQRGPGWLTPLFANPEAKP